MWLLRLRFGCQIEFAVRDGIQCGSDGGHRDWEGNRARREDYLVALLRRECCGRGGIERPWHCTHRGILDVTQLFSLGQCLLLWLLLWLLLPR